MDHTTPLKKDCFSLENGKILRGTIEPFVPEHRVGGLITLRLRQADGTRIEILTDAIPTLTQLIAEFGSVYASERQQIEFSMSVLGAPRLRALRGTGPEATDPNCVASPQPETCSDPESDR